MLGVVLPNPYVLIVNPWLCVSHPKTDGCGSLSTGSVDVVFMDFVPHEVGTLPDMDQYGSILRNSYIASLIYEDGSNELNIYIYLSY